MSTKMRYSFEEFEKACTHQGVTLSDSVIQPGHDELRYRGGSFNNTPNSLLAAIEGSSYTTCYFPGEPLADKIIEPTRDFAVDTATQSLIKIVNGSIEPQTPKPGQLNFKTSEGQRLDTCAFADHGFMKTFIGLSEMLRDGSVKHACHIITHKGEPVFIRKYLGIMSTINLREVNINGIEYPAGSILSASFRGNSEPNYDEETQTLGVQVSPYTIIDKINFLRLSAFALIPKERKAAGFRSYQSATDWEADLFHNATIADFRYEAEDALVRLDRLVASERGLGRTALVGAVEALG